MRGTVFIRCNISRTSCKLAPDTTQPPTHENTRTPPLLLAPLGASWVNLEKFPVDTGIGPRFFDPPLSQLPLVITGELVGILVAEGASNARVWHRYDKSYSSHWRPCRGLERRCSPLITNEKPETARNGKQMVEPVEPNRPAQDCENYNFFVLPYPFRNGSMRLWQVPAIPFFSSIFL